MLQLSGEYKLWHAPTPSNDPPPVLWPVLSTGDLRPLCSRYSLSYSRFKQFLWLQSGLLKLDNDMTISCQRGAHHQGPKSIRVKREQSDWLTGSIDQETHKLCKIIWYHELDQTACISSTYQVCIFCAIFKHAIAFKPRSDSSLCCCWSLIRCVLYVTVEQI